MTGKNGDDLLLKLYTQLMSETPSSSSWEPLHGDFLFVLITEIHSLKHHIRVLEVGLVAILFAGAVFLVESMIH